MMLLCSNDSSRAFVALARQNPARLGWIQGPTHWKNPRPGISYALDNDAFTCWKKGIRFNADAWRRMLDKASAFHRPMWVLCPDVVADRGATLDAWNTYSSEASKLGAPVAFAVQDGMSVGDVPYAADVVFVGGTTEWKWSTAKMWCDNFSHVHIGRTNGIRRLWMAQRLGAKSADGSGYFCDTINGSSGRKLLAWLHHVTDPQHELNLA